MKDVPRRLNPFGFMHGEVLAGYELVDRSGEAPIEGADLQAVGRGGAGVVYRARIKGLDRAVKILIPLELSTTHEQQLSTEEMQLQEAWKRYEQTFHDEIRYLSTVTHTNIAKILDFGEFSEGKAKERPYYVMEYIDGVPFSVFAARCTAFRDVLHCVTEILNALVFLHEHHRTLHFDLNGDNVLVRPLGDSHQVVLVDLGVARKVDPPTLELFDDNDEASAPYVFSTAAITRVERRSLLNTRIAWQRLQDEFFPDHDLYALGVLLRSVLQTEHVQSLVMKELDVPSREALSLITTRLIGPSSEQYESAGDVLEAFSKLDRRFLAPFGIPELGISGDARIGVALPGTRVRLTKRMAALVNQAAFQRLRNLNQLNFVHLLFPGAKHSRFTHSLMTYNYTREFVGYLLDDAHFRLLVHRPEIESVLCLSLLHDLGHYPLSHMFEDMREQEQPDGTEHAILMDDDLLACFVCSDEALTPQQLDIRARMSDVFAAHGYAGEHRMDKCIAREYGITVLDWLGQLADKSKAPPDSCTKVLRGILDSPIDTDKVSYLQLDSMMSGTSYGAGIDLDGLFASLRCVSENELQHAGASIAITDKGLSAAESVIMARYWMIRRVYWHHANRSIMAMIRATLDGLLSTGCFDFNRYFSDTLFLDDAASLRLICDDWSRNAALIAELAGSSVVNPAEGLLGGGRRIYKRLLTLSAKGPALDQALFQKMTSATQGAMTKLRQALEESLANLMGVGQANAGTVLVDVPRKERENTGGTLFVYPTDSRLQPFNIFESPVLGGLKDEFDQHTKKARVFVSPLLMEDLKRRGLVEKSRTALTEVMCAHFRITR